MIRPTDCKLCYWARLFLCLFIGHFVNLEFAFAFFAIAAILIAIKIGINL